MSTGSRLPVTLPYQHACSQAREKERPTALEDVCVASQVPTPGLRRSHPHRDRRKKNQPLIAVEGEKGRASVKPACTDACAWSSTGDTPDRTSACKAEKQAGSCSPPFHRVAEP